MEFTKRILLASVLALFGVLCNSASAQQLSSDFRTGPVTEPIGETYKTPAVVEAPLSRVTFYRAAQGPGMGATGLEINGHFHTALQLGSFSELCMAGPAKASISPRLVRTGGQHAVVITFTDVAGNTSTVNAAPVFISTGIANITLSVDAVTADNTISGTEAALNGNTDITGKASGEFKADIVVAPGNHAPVPSGSTSLADPFGTAAQVSTPTGTTKYYGTFNSTTVDLTNYKATGANGTNITGGSSVNNLPWLLSPTVTNAQAFRIDNSPLTITINKPLPYFDVYFSNFDEGATNNIQFYVNGSLYHFTGNELTHLAAVTSSAASGTSLLDVSTAIFSTDGTKFLGSTDAATTLGGQFRIPAPAGGGITKFQVVPSDNIVNFTTAKTFIGFVAMGVTVSGPAVTAAQTVEAMFGGAHYSDSDSDLMKGVVITNAGASADITGKGNYQYSTDGGTTWTDLAVVLTDATGVYLNKTDLIRFKSIGTTATAIKQNLVAHLVDTSSVSSMFTTSGATVDVSGANSGGSTAVSSAAITITGSTAPVVLDLNHDGVMSYSQVQMDVTGDGVLDQTAWAAAQDGVLVWDKSGDGQVHDNSQYAFAQYGAAGSTDLQGLAAGFDSNADGVFNAQDAKFAQFAVWQDANQDGVVQAGEMRTLSDVGVTAINLASDGVVRAPNASVVEAGHSTAQLADGTTMVVADAEFGVQALSYNIDTTAPDATKLVLTGAGMDLSLSTFAAKHGAIAEVDLSGTGANSIKLTLADLLQGTSNATLTVTGDADDSANVNLADWTSTGNTVAQNGHTYAVYNDAASHTAQLLIDQNLVNAGHVI